MDDIQFKKNYSAAIHPGYSVHPNTTPAQKTQNTAQGGEFARLFQQSLQQTKGLTFSKHAIQRLESRSIAVSPELVSQISNAVEQARAKGVKDALILDGKTAFIVNVPSSTVITTMNGGELSGNVFTNIDGAVVL